MPQKKEIQIVKMSKDTPDEGSEKPPKETTVPLSVQPRNIRDTAETSTPYSKKKQVSELISYQWPQGLQFIQNTENNVLSIIWC